MSSPVELVYFTVNGYWYDIEAPLPGGSTSTPQFLVTSAFIDFIPRVPAGFSLEIANLDVGSGTTHAVSLELATITARIINGALCTIDLSDTVGVQLLAYSPAVAAALTAKGIPSLIYDVRFREVVYAEQVQNLDNFGFTAPSGASTVTITDPALTRLPYGQTN